MYYVEQKYYPNGQVKTEIYTESEIIRPAWCTPHPYAVARPGCPYHRQKPDHDVYVDAVDTYEQAKQLINDLNV